MRSGATQNIHNCCNAQPPAKIAQPEGSKKFRDGTFTERHVDLLGREKDVVSSVKKAGGEAYPVATADGMRLETLAASPFGKPKSP